ncbi:hypothetical protein L3X16_17145 [Pseudomonas stutzeri]|nr:hypothetical protein [Stutzerimonas stutzeri]
MKPKQSLEWVKGFESRSDKINYNIAGVDCWPIVRNTLLSIVLPKSSQGASIAGVSAIDILRSLKDLLFFKGANVFILSDSKFSEEISSSLYLKDSHVITERAKLQSKVSIIALQNIFVDQTIVGRERCRSVFGVLLLAAAAAKLSHIMKYIPGLSSYIEGLFAGLVTAPMLHDGSVSCTALKKQVYRNILFCLVASKLFSFILRRVKPENTYVVCYYSILGMALCAACHQLGIPVTDIQHGVAGGSMRAYAGWVKVPRQGYTTLPDTFFCWTKFDAEAITDWAQHTDRHRAIVTGSLWRDYVKEQSLLVGVERQWESFFKEINKYKKRVLITMQSSTLAPLFVELVKKSVQSYCFLIRKHPGFALENNDIYNDFSANYPNVFFEQPSSLPIQAIMKNVDVHLTEWSGAVIDAYFEGVRSIVISEEALDYFEYFIAGGEVVFARELNDILNAL